MIKSKFHQMLQDLLLHRNISDFQDHCVQTEEQKDLGKGCEGRAVKERT